MKILSATLIMFIVISLFMGAVMLSIPAEAKIVVKGENTSPLVKEIAIVVSRKGFNGSRDLNIEANQGDQLRLVFLYGDGDLESDNPHKIEIEGYNVAVEINREETIGVVELKANQPGTFKIRCVLRCRGHENLQEGLIKVKEVGQLPKISTLKLSAQENNETRTYLLVAEARTEDGLPVRGVQIEFLTSSSFGYVSIGTSATNQEGKAVMEYKPVKAGPLQILAVYKADKTVNATLPLNPAFVSPPVLPFELSEANVRGENLWPDPRLVGTPARANAVLLVLLAAVVLTAWGIVLWSFRSIIQLKRGETVYER
ncbi:MAG: hypothetical protein QXR26_07080 [Candidatus Caldarchaeum sp.]